MKNSEIIKKHWPQWYEMMHWHAKAKGVGLSWRKPWRVFRWFYYMRKASKCIPKNMPMHRNLFDHARGPDETVWTCVRCRYSWKSSEHAGPECSKCYAELTRK